MTVCVVGSGAREHALACQLARFDEVIVTPGNPGMEARIEGTRHIRITATPPEEIEAALTVIGPEMPLVDGLADRLRAKGRLVFGPGADGARLEGSKAFMKEVLAEAGVPTARFGTFDRLTDAAAFLDTLPGPWVVKTDGLAAGKGVLVAETRAEAEADIATKLSGDAFGDAGRRIVIEEGLSGTECSLLFLCDGTRVVPLSPAQDFKRIADGDLGPNTGGMGAYSPVPGVNATVIDEVTSSALEPTMAALRRRGIDFRGVLYAGIMLTEDGPKILEFNVRFGDPETQVVLPRLDEDLVGLLTAAAAGDLTPNRRDLRHTDDAAVCVVLAAPGYPTAPEIGAEITGLGPDGQPSEPVDGVTVFHAGTRQDAPGAPFRTAGGRVLSVTALAPTLDDARVRAYRVVDTIAFPGMQVRRDIAGRAAAEVRA